jgi:hypothetical protein
MRELCSEVTGHAVSMLGVLVYQSCGDCRDNFRAGAAPAFGARAA